VNMRTIRILVVEDSVTIRKRLIEVFAAEPGMEVVAEAGDGKAGIELCRELRPDLVTLDMVLPVMSGLAATEYIMAYCPTPILIVSSSSNRGEMFKTFDALAAGAVDVLDKPRGDEENGAWERMLLAKARMVSNIRVITHLRARVARAAADAAPRTFGGGPCPPGVYRLLAVGASTGGPAAFLAILRSLPPGFPLPIVLVMHIGLAFGAFLREWLESQSAYRVSYAKDGEPLSAAAPGRVLLAPPDYHLEAYAGRWRLNQDPERHSCRPSVDVLFESLARTMGRQTIACLLTGMGTDGAHGLLAIRQAAGRTLVQDQATSVVFGMPQEAIRLGAADQVLGLDEFAPALAALAQGNCQRPA
jgi:two-component system, chemotaxis family, protein-glutamate methylesterase/glutaminase